MVGGHDGGAFEADGRVDEESVFVEEGLMEGFEAYQELEVVEPEGVGHRESPDADAPAEVGERSC